VVNHHCLIYGTFTAAEETRAGAKGLSLTVLQAEEVYMILKGTGIKFTEFKTKCLKH
jgi:hypothetical protein